MRDFFRFTINLLVPLAVIALIFGDIEEGAFLSALICAGTWTVLAAIREDRS